MKYLLPLLFILFTPLLGSAQKKVNTKAEEKTITEGYKLYKSEMASWLGTDLFLQNHADLTEKAGGYFSYVSDEGINCIFFSKGENPKVLVSFTFDETFDKQKVKVAQQERPFTDLEINLHQIRTTALAEINSDTLFQTFNNTSLNLVPLIEGTSKKVYVLTGPQVNGVVILGNDYLLFFDKNNKVTSKQKLHQNIIPIDYAEDKSKEISTMHTHLASTGDYMTPTDVCTLLLYGKMSNWKQHFTLSEHFVSIWDVEKRNHITLTRKAWEKISKHSAEARSKD